MRRCLNASERIFSIERPVGPSAALIALLLALGVAPVSAQTLGANNGYDVSTGSTNVQPGDLGLNRAVADGDKRRAQANKADNGFSAQTAPPRVLQPQPDYAKYPVYTGVIGAIPNHKRRCRKTGVIDIVPRL